MLEKFKTKELITIALFGAVNFLLIFVLGTGIITITGVPASGGILNLLISMLITIVCVKTISKFGTASIMLAITGALAIPTLSFGPPGIHKILMLFLMGFILDLVITLLGKSRTSYLIAGIVVGMLAAPIIYASLILLGLPGADKLQPVLITFSAIYAVLGGIGAYLGLWIYDKKLKNKAFVRQMRGE